MTDHFWLYALVGVLAGLVGIALWCITVEILL